MNIELHSAFSDCAAQEEGGIFAPKFDEKGLVTAVVSDAASGMCLMVAHMNEEAVKLTLQTGIAHYWSRSRGKIWKKGEASGNLQKVLEIRTDCDQDALWLKVIVEGHGATCHTGRLSCFYRRIMLENSEAILVTDEEKPLFDPATVYTS